MEYLSFYIEAKIVNKMREVDIPFLPDRHILLLGPIPAATVGVTLPGLQAGRLEVGSHI